MTKPVKPTFHIAIFGVGLKSLAAAIKIARAGHKVGVDIRIVLAPCFRSSTRSHVLKMATARRTPHTPCRIPQDPYCGGGAPRRKIKLGSVISLINFKEPSTQIVGKPSDYNAETINGADGLKPICREAILGRPVPARFTEELAYRIIIKASDMRIRPDFLDLVENLSINYWLGPSAHAVCYLLGNLY
ncbi:MAG: hypothetical protein Q9213_002133 [Squamulea squamosa]